jgi:hypothetical protein
MRLCGLCQQSCRNNQLSGPEPMQADRCSHLASSAEPANVLQRFDRTAVRGRRPVVRYMTRTCQWAMLDHERHAAALLTGSDARSRFPPGGSRVLEVARRAIPSLAPVSLHLPESDPPQASGPLSARVGTTSRFVGGSVRSRAPGHCCFLAGAEPGSAWSLGGSVGRAGGKKWDGGRCRRGRRSYWPAALSGTSD